MTNAAEVDGRLSSPAVYLKDDIPLKVKPDLSRQRARCDVVRAAEGGKEVVQRIFVGQVDDGELSAPLVSVAVKQIVVSDRKIEQVA